MEKPRRDNLRAVVAKARAKIEASLASQLAGFGLFRDTEPAPKEDLRLGPAQETVYPRLLDVILREGRAVGKEGRISPEGVARFVREFGATWVNRLAALRALEVRGLLSPAAAFVSDQYGGASPRGVRLRDEVAAENRMSRDESIRAGIEEACLELSASVRVLFDLSDEQSLLWPGLTELREVLRDFSADVTMEDWAEPDVLGWVYQYYNTDANAELKKRKNKTTGFKYKPDDIPIANQFYTPHWVVRVLADNTLGRLWLEAHDRLPRIDTEPYRLAEARAGVPHAADEPEAFKKWILEEADPLTDKTVDRLCRFLAPLPSQPLPRARKSVREIRVLDPACGSGHFLLYAFDLLFAMYREGEPDLDPREIPALILANNLFGVDIDLRAAQLAAFSLYLKARATLARIDPQATLNVRGLNIVVADTHIGSDPRKAAFLERHKDDPEVRQLYAKVLSDLDHTNVLGSLLKVRTEFEMVFGRIRDAKGENSGWTSSDQQELLDVRRQPELAETFRSFSGRKWTIADLLDDLRRFEREVAPAQDVGARLFYTDLERSVGLLTILSQKYDVVLMNPPYGEMPQEAKDYLAGSRRKNIPAHYPRTHGDLFTAFIEQGLDLTVPNGFLGALVPWSYMFLSTLEQVRSEILSKEARPELVQEYGYGILDGATVGTVGTIARKLPPSKNEPLLQHPAVFNRLSEKRKDLEKQNKFLETLPVYAASGPRAESDWFVARLESLRDVPGMPYAYWASDTLRALFRRLPPLDRDQNGVLLPGRPDVRVAETRFGLQTSDDSRFLRFWWEVEPSELSSWPPFAKGGRDVCFYARVDLRVDWRKDGEAIKEWNARVGGGSWSRNVRSVDKYFLPGVTWANSAWRLRRFGLVQPGAIFSHRGPMVFPATRDPYELCGILNSNVANALLLLQTPERNWEVGIVGALPIPEVPHTTTAQLAKTLELLKRRRHEGDETCRDFVIPELRQAWDRAEGDRRALEALLAETIELRYEAEREIETDLAALDASVYSLYGISEEDRALIEREIARRERPGSVLPVDDLTHEDEDDVPPDTEDADLDREDPLGSELSPLRTRDLVARWLSLYLKPVLESNQDGITSVSPTRTEMGLSARLREAIEKDLGQDATASLWGQVPRYLGTEDLTEWLSISREETVEIDGKNVKLPIGFFTWHVDLYQKRPIFWLLSSEGFERGRTRFRFQVYLHYLKLTPDTLRRLVSHYLEPVIEDYVHKEWTDAQARASRLDGRLQSAANAEAEEWLNTLDALKVLRTAIGAVIEGPRTAEPIPANAKWLARTIAAVRGGQDVGHGYKPDIDYGVRVNIAPLVEKKLLPKLALKKLGG